MTTYGYKVGFYINSAEITAIATVLATKGDDRVVVSDSEIGEFGAIDNFKTRDGNGIRITQPRVGTIMIRTDIEVPENEIWEVVSMCTHTNAEVV